MSLHASQAFSIAHCTDLPGTDYTVLFLTYLKFEYGFYWSLTTVYTRSFYHVATVRVKAVLEEQQQRMLFLESLILVPDRRSGSNNHKIVSTRSHTYLWSIPVNNNNKVAFHVFDEGWKQPSYFGKAVATVPSRRNPRNLFSSSVKSTPTTILVAVIKAHSNHKTNLNAKTNPNPVLQKTCKKKLKKKRLKNYITHGIPTRDS